MYSCNFWSPTSSGTGSYGRCQIAGVRQNFGKSRVLKKLAITRTIQLSALFYRGTLSRLEGFTVVFLNEIYCKVAF